MSSVTFRGSGIIIYRWRCGVSVKRQMVQHVYGISCGEKALPVSLGKNAVEYLCELHDLEIAKTYATSHAEREQNRYVTHYNLRSRDKHFECGEEVLILMPDISSSCLHSKWTGPATAVEVFSP